MRHKYATIVDALSNRMTDKEGGEWILSSSGDSWVCIRFDRFDRFSSMTDESERLEQWRPRVVLGRRPGSMGATTTAVFLYSGGTVSMHPEMQLGLLVGQYVLAREKFFQDPDVVCAWLLERERAQADATRWRVESVTFEDGEFVVTKVNLAMEALSKVDLPGVPKAPAGLAETQSTVDFLGLFIQAAIQHDGQTRVAKGADNG